MINTAAQVKSAAQSLARQAATLNAGVGLLSVFDVLPRLFLFTDRQRLNQPENIMSLLPAGSGVILRHYHLARAQRRDYACRLMRISQDFGLQLFIAGDAKLACEVGADGVHLPEHLLGQPLAWLLQARQKNLAITASVHSEAAMKRAACLPIDGVFLSPVFSTASHPDRKPLGVMRFTKLIQASPQRVLALGGIDLQSIARLKNSGAYGVGVIGALKTTDAGS